MAAFIMHNPPQRSPFAKAALKMLESINKLEHFIVKHWKDYVDLYHATEQERTTLSMKWICFVLKLAFFVKACKDQIDIPKSRIHDEESDGNSTRWLSVRHDSSHADVIAHKHGMLQSLVIFL
ncbi:syntaxin-81-like [Asparagus officinalis]|uniref:syntaxin-81-like n=1 Tax=Asparagus officinalis TaxID=4686 RepID=UPI00098E401D|nr:syntaxin-81-like [Asparagus officinalis]